MSTNKPPNQIEIDAGARLLERRIELNLSLTQVARKVGMSGIGYGHLEVRFSKLRQQKYLALVARALGVHPDWILHGTDHPTINNECPAEGGASTKIGPLPTKEQRESLGKRARDRRRALNVGLSPFANAIGIKEDKFKNWESCLAVRQDEALEDKWEALLGVPKGWLRDSQQSTPPLNHQAFTNPCDFSPCANVADELRCVGAWLSRSQRLYRTTQWSLLHPSEQRLANIFAERYGVAGEDASTLQSIGERYGVTRERIRQMVDKMVSRAGEFSGQTHQLDKLANELPAMLPQTLSGLNETLRPVLGEDLSLQSVERFAREVLGRSIVKLIEPQSTNPNAGGLIAVNAGDHDEETFRVVRTVALSMIRSTGAAQVDFVAGAVGTELKCGITSNEVARLCSLADGFEWLVERDGWFWLGPNRENRLLTVAKKVLACARQSVDVEDIHSAMARSRREYFVSGKSRTYSIDAPHAVLVATLRKTPWILNIQHDDFRLREPVEPELVLSESELALYKLLISKGCIAARYTISEELLNSEQYSRGAMALAYALDESPILLRLGRGIFALRGVSLSADALAAASAAVGGSNSQRRQAVVADEKGFIRLEFALSENAIKSRYWELPASLAEHLTAGDFDYPGESDPVTYTISPSGARRLNRFVSKLVKAGFQAGDLVALGVHPQQRRIVIERPEPTELTSTEASHT